LGHDGARIVGYPPLQCGSDALAESSRIKQQDKRQSHKTLYQAMLHNFSPSVGLENYIPE
jgi:hypothetical protein